MKEGKKTRSYKKRRQDQLKTPSKDKLKYEQIMWNRSTYGNQIKIKRVKLYILDRTAFLKVEYMKEIEKKNCINI